MAPSYIDSKGNLHDKAPWHHQVLVFMQEAWLALWLFFSTLINGARCETRGDESETNSKRGGRRRRARVQPMHRYGAALQEATVAEEEEEEDQHLREELGP
ncbi:BZ3500_MvSof-1268-A1-R1_Chr1-3g01833 [Microbotryum saponariae]|uniref:BZ3500_MvSof-1268-A1-R1_Chr1-3g01833 protein n=1 Tax=Microbotryum saponariae TaxID=289078 RepID=A0A2X0KCW9_9BASI|nr:BZ3500_MvSof-1268-A1-R1_Chr1-3g01833 [Microbotryum saponariae]SCZ94703.1 BZ3501_MvSof-1269-A2-R1_Chr1-3g01435 [Microbotryum saponariae]